MKYRFNLQDTDGQNITIESDDIETPSDMVAVLNIFLGDPNEMHTGKEIFNRLAGTIDERRITQIVRDLRLKNVPLVLVDGKICLATKVQQILDFADYLEGRGKKNVMSYMVLRKGMLKMVSRKRPSLFDAIMDENTHEWDEEPQPVQSSLL